MSTSMSFLSTDHAAAPGLLLDAPGVDGIAFRGDLSVTQETGVDPGAAESERLAVDAHWPVLHVNERHHSVAIAAVNRLPINPIRTRIQHLNIQVAELDDMTASYQRVKQLGFNMALAVGQHTNDKELSYYAMTPSGFEWEVGWNPIVVDEKTWEPTHVSGHQHLGPHPRGADASSTNWASSRLQRSRCCSARIPSSPRWPTPAFPTIRQKASMLRIDTHHHLIPPDYRKALQKAGLGRIGRTGNARLEPGCVVAGDGRARRRHRDLVGVDPGHGVSAQPRPTRRRSGA